MGKMVIRSKEKKNRLSDFLEGFLYGLGEVCHNVFGAVGELGMYKAIGKYFYEYLKLKKNFSLTKTDPWERYCMVIEIVTELGFYSYVELDQIGENSYRMLEAGQYAGKIWEGQKSWQRGTPPCPLWSLLLEVLREIGFTLILDVVNYNKELEGYESVFHFEKLKKADVPDIESTRELLSRMLIPICARCMKIRDEEGKWIKVDAYFEDRVNADFTHSLCPDCVHVLDGKKK